MSKLQVFAGKKTGRKKGLAEGDVSTSSIYYIYYGVFKENFFNAEEEGCSIGSTITNVSTGDTALVTGFEIYNDIDYRIYIDSDIFVPTSEEDQIFEIDVFDEFSETEYTELDLFEDETVEITQNIKDFKDISKILTDYTQSFKIPASKANNRYFEHYYNQGIVDGFDARFRYDCILKLNGVDWKEGQIRLTDVSMKNGSADNYQITFFGNIVSLKTILGDDELDVLEYLDAFNHSISLTNVANYSQYGALLNFDSEGNPTGISTAQFIDVPDMIYPFISHSKNRYYLDTSDSSPDIKEVRNVATLNPPVNDEYHNILYTDLKPAIRVIRIIRAIESKYNIKFSDDFIREDSKPFEMLYMMMSRESGSLDSKVEESKKELYLGDFVFSSGTDVRKGSGNNYVELFTGGRSGNGSQKVRLANISGNIIVSENGSYDIRVIDAESSVLYYEALNVSGNFSFKASVASRKIGSSLVKPKIVLTTKGGITLFSTDLSIESKYYDRRFGDISSDTGVYQRTPNASLSNGLDIRNSMTPKIKCIDFLKNIFKMFNIVAYVEDGVIVAKPYDDYYRDGNEVDLSYCIDNSSHKVSRADIYSEINFKYKDSKDVITTKRNELTNTEYGNLDFISDETTSFDGGKYDISVSFSKILSEGMVNESTNRQSGVSWGYAVSDSFSPVDINSLIFTSTNKNVSPLGYVTDGNSVNVFNIAYHSPMNIYYDEKGRWSSINFGEEIAPYLPGSTNPYTQVIRNSLFTNFYESQILNIYNELSRLVKYTCYPNLKDVMSIKLNDTIIVNSKKYFINSIKNNITSGKTEMTLIAKSIELPVLEKNQFYETNKDGNIELFSSYPSYGFNTSSSFACSSSSSTLYVFRNLAISESGYVYRYEGSSLMLNDNFAGSANRYTKLEGYTHDIIEVNASGLIVNKINC